MQKMDICIDNVDIDLLRKQSRKLARIDMDCFRFFGQEGNHATYFPHMDSRDAEALAGVMNLIDAIIDEADETQDKLAADK